MRSSSYLSAMLLLLPLLSVSQLPSDNPYATRYGVHDHWTNNVRWSKVTDASKVAGLLKSGNKVDSAVIHQTLKRISAQGGGVLYFPAGTYYFNYHVKLPTGVVIRGASPEGITDALQQGYRPPTSFEFPKYNPTFNGCGTSNNSAFKTIYGDTMGLKNAGLVNLDINRATINFFSGGYRQVITLSGDVWQSKYNHDNIIIFGLRQNNAAIPSPEIPTQAMVDKGNCWQRWPYRYIGNINLFVTTNCVVANCRLNDAVTDDYEQPDYVDDHYGMFTGKQAKFSYLDHPGICINAYKVVSWGTRARNSGKWGSFATLDTMLKHPGFREVDSVCDPIYFTPGDKEVRDNYIHVKGRHHRIMTYANINRINNVSVSNTEPNYLLIGGRYSRQVSSPTYVEKLFEQKEFISADKQDTMHYLVKEPTGNDPNKKYPLVVYLHSEDVSTTALDKRQVSLFLPILCTEENLKKYPCYILVPQEKFNSSLNNWVLGDRVTLAKTTQFTKIIMDDMMNKLNIDRDRIYVIGVAKGATGTWKFAIRYPELFAAIVAVDGIEDAFRPYEWDTLVKHRIPFWTSVPRAYAQLSLFLDTRLNAIAMREAGLDAKFKFVPGASKNDMLHYYMRDPDFLPWLFTRRKSRINVNQPASK
ncbi:MAG TPA: hypothetical protein VD996_16625 [Chitinophagaceae bacterium]|nr:hypothetical protein [Chitinophagaceae bacterium]